MMNIKLERKVEEKKKSKRSTVVQTGDNIKKWTGLNLAQVRCEKEGQSKLEVTITANLSRDSADDDGNDGDDDDDD